jgi:hypothetical protein
MLTKAQIESLLGRSLTSTESSNLELYLEIAQERLERLVCFSLDAEGVLKYDPRKGYHTLFVNPFTSINSITIDGEEVEDYEIKQWDEP